MEENIIKKLKSSGLLGRGGACFPVWKKWEMVKSAGRPASIICNGSEGEPGVSKDYHILKRYPEKVIDGINLAVDFLLAQDAYIYLNPEYYKKLKENLDRLTADTRIKIFVKNSSAGYIGGEESSAINHIEGRRIEPRLKPPYPPASGLRGNPTLVNNVETFYSVSRIAGGSYEKKRFITINGDCLWTGVYEYPEDWTIEKILKTSGNYPDFSFFVQAGGDASGEVLNSRQLKQPVSGSGSITIHSLHKHEPMALMKKWIDFFVRESCGQCTPCREGTFRIRDLLYEKHTDWSEVSKLLDNLSESSFCGLGCAVPIPFKSYAKNVLPFLPNKNINLSKENRKIICDCFGK